MVFELSLFKNPQTITATWTYSSDIIVQDDVKINFGSDSDFWMSYRTDVLNLVIGSASSYYLRVNSSALTPHPTTYDLGSSTKPFRKLFLGENSGSGIALGAAQEALFALITSVLYLNYTSGSLEANLNLARFDVNTFFLIRDPNNSDTILFSFDVANRTCAIGSGTDLVTQSLNGEKIGFLSHSVDLQELEQSVATATLSGTSSDTAQSFWQLTGNGSRIRTKNSISVPKGATKMAITIVASTVTGVSASVQMKYSLNGAALVSGTQFTATTSGGNSQEDVITVTEYDYINVLVEKITGANDAKILGIYYQFY